MDPPSLLWVFNQRSTLKERFQNGMLQAPRTEAKKQSGATRPQPAPEFQPELHAPFASPDLVQSSALPGFRGPSSGIQVRQHFAGLQRTIGNQAVLRNCA
jgi:hypothetical protein